MEVSVPNLNVLPVCLPLPKKERKKKRQNVVKVVKGKALLLLLVYTYVLGQARDFLIDGRCINTFFLKTF